MAQSHDKIYAEPLSHIDIFSFDEQVASVFPDMIQRSVPGYSTIIAMIGDIAERYAKPDSHCYDLGCSLGAATLAMRHRIKATQCTLISIDNSQAMIEKCQQHIDTDTLRSGSSVPVTLQCADISSIPIERASVVVLNFTLQFIPLAQRRAILDDIYQGLLPGGVLILSEKVAFDDTPHHDLMVDLHHNFKRANGYSDLEIAQKRTALEQVLQPETIETHRQRLKSIGFNSSDVWFQCFNFASMIAVK